VMVMVMIDDDDDDVSKQYNLVLAKVR